MQWRLGAPTVVDRWRIEAAASCRHGNGGVTPPSVRHRSDGAALHPRFAREAAVTDGASTRRHRADKAMKFPTCSEMGTYPRSASMQGWSVAAKTAPWFSWAGSHNARLCELVGQ